MEQGDGLAGLGPVQAATLYGGEVLLADVEDEPDNVTRFVAVARGDGVARPAPGRSPTAPVAHSLVFWGTGDGTPGWLVSCLGEFSGRGLNMSRIESRPRRGRLEQYLFFVDLDARDDDGPVREALGALAARCEAVRVLGSYPAA